MSRSVGQYRANIPLIGAKTGGRIRRILDRIIANQLVGAFNVCSFQTEIIR